MKKTGMTTLEVRKYNKSKVYELIYERHSISKQEISNILQMSLTTVTHNLKLLETEEMITITGQYESTGGRKPNIYSIVTTAGIAIGIAVLKNCVHFVAIDLYGEILQKDTRPLLFSAEDSYYQKLGAETTQFVDQLDPRYKDKILGVGIAIQGLVSADGQTMSDGAIMNCTGMKLSELSAYIPYTCRLEHDSTATAAMELWCDKSLKDAVIYILNHNLGGAIIIDGKIHYGQNMRSGSMEHMCMDASGPQCYCGRRGCLETFCSADSLEKAAGMDLETYFKKLRQGDEFCREVWLLWLTNLSKAIGNINVVIDCDIVLSGYLAPYLIEDDIRLLKELVNTHSTYCLNNDQIRTNHYGALAPASGAALPYIKKFLEEI